MNVRTITACYGYPSARVFDQASVDVIFVGDPVGMDVLGYNPELDVTMDDMLHHLNAGKRGVRSKTLMVDLLYSSYSWASRAGAPSAKGSLGMEKSPCVSTGKWRR